MPPSAAEIEATPLTSLIRLLETVVSCRCFEEFLSFFLQAILNQQSLSIQVQLLNGRSVTLDTDSSTSISDVIDDVKQQLNIPVTSRGWAVYEVRE